MDQKKSVRDTFQQQANHKTRDAGITICGTVGAGYAGSQLIQAAVPVMLASRGDIAALGFMVGAIAAFLVLATALKL